MASPLKLTDEQMQELVRGHMNADAGYINLLLDEFNELCNLKLTDFGAVSKDQTYPKDRVKHFIRHWFFPLSVSHSKAGSCKVESLIKKSSKWGRTEWGNYAKILFVLTYFRDAVDEDIREEFWVSTKGRVTTSQEWASELGTKNRNETEMYTRLLDQVNRYIDILNDMDEEDIPLDWHEGRFKPVTRDMLNHLYTHRANKAPYKRMIARGVWSDNETEHEDSIYFLWEDEFDKPRDITSLFPAGSKAEESDNGRITRLQEMLVEKDKEIDSLKEELLSVGIRHQDLDGTNGNSDKVKNAELREQLQKQQQELNTLTHDKIALQNQVQMLEQDITACQSENQELKKQVIMTRDDANAIQAEESDKTKYLTELESANRTLEEELDELKEEHEALQEEHKALQNKKKITLKKK